MKYCSIICTHYSLADDSGETRLGVKMTSDMREEAEEKGFKMEDYTRSKLLKIHMKTLLENTDYPYELIVVDNGGNPDDTDFLLDLTRKKKITTLIRNADNMLFGYGRNQALAMATGNYICIMDNDLEFQKGWLTACVGLLERYSDRKLIATPYLSPDKDNDKYNLPNIDGNRMNGGCGSNCMIMTPETLKDVGQFRYSQVAGTYWHRTLSKRGYSIIMPPKDMIFHTGCFGGLNFHKKVRVIKTLSNGEEAIFHDY